MNKKPLRSLFVFALLNLALVGSSNRAVAASIVWDGGPSGTGTVLTDPANWTGDVFPSSADDAVFDGSVVSTPATLEVNSDAALGGIQFLSNVTTPTITIGNATASPVTLFESSATPNPLIAVS